MCASIVMFTEPSREASTKQMEGLQDTIKEILIRAEADGRLSSEIADAMAMERTNLKRKA